MGKYSREKGKRGEREVAAILRAHGYDAHRGQQYHGGKDSPDVVGLPGCHIEVKFTQAFHLWDALAQSASDCEGSGEIPLVVHRKAVKQGDKALPWVVVLTLEDFLRIYGEAYGKCAV